MRDLRSYVVRVYRQHAGGVDGTVQEVRTGRTAPFRTMEELWQAVCTASPRSGARASRRRDRSRAPAERPDSDESDAGSNDDGNQA